MSRKREVIKPDTPPTLFEHIATALFWGVVIGWPMFVLIYRWLH